jgi:hypothetical protein
MKILSPLDLTNNRISNVADPTSDQDVATRAYVLARIAALVNSAPGVLDTLAEIASALGNDANFATTVANAITAAADRANHSGTQLSTTISDFDTAVNALITASGGGGSYATTIGDGTATSFTITHGLNSRDVIVQVREAASPWSYPGVDVAAATTGTVTLSFTTAPSINQYRVLVLRVGS